MKKIEFVYREILSNAIEKKEKQLTQAYLSRTLKISLSTVHLALQPLVRMYAIKVNPRSFRVIDTRKILYYWASIRNLEKDIVFKTRIEEPIKEIEKQIPNSSIFTAYSAYKFIFKDVPADYSEVYVYDTLDIKKRWKENVNNPNLFVLQKDYALEHYSNVVPLAQLFVDLWNLKTWYAKDFLIALENRIGRMLE